MSRADLRQQFLENSSFAGASLEALPVDASFRSYFRILGGDKRALLMDAPPPVEDVRPFVRIARHLVELGLSAPLIYDCDEKQGFLTLEDFGDETYTRLLAAGESEQALYGLGIDALVSLHKHKEATAVEAPVYSLDVMLAESLVFTEWFYPWLIDSKPTHGSLDGYLSAWQQILQGLPKPASSLVLRDYHVDNLMRLGDREGVAACGLLDFQDALIGPAAYDVVSLLEDARRDLSPGLVEEMLARYGAADENFMQWYHVLGAQRHCRVLGVFVRLFERDDKDVYLKHLPRVARLLLSHLDQAELLPLRNWVEQHLEDRLAAFAAGQ
jgi:aminoglycoside/choline kinase family phosphotransferase